jgi:hypothetical protein
MFTRLLLFTVMLAIAMVFADLSDVDKKKHKHVSQCVSEIAAKICPDCSDMNCIVKCLDDNPDAFKDCKLKKNQKSDKPAKKGNSGGDSSGDDGDNNLSNAVTSKLAVRLGEKSGYSVCPWNTWYGCYWGECCGNGCIDW